MYTPPTALPIQPPTAPRTVPSIVDGRRPSQPDDWFGAMLNRAVADRDAIDGMAADPAAEDGAVEDGAAGDGAAGDGAVEDGVATDGGVTGTDARADGTEDPSASVEASERDDATPAETAAAGTDPATAVVALDPDAPPLDAVPEGPDTAEPTPDGDPAAVADAAPVAADAAMSAGFRARLQAAGTPAGQTTAEDPVDGVTGMSDRLSATPADTTSAPAGATAGTATDGPDAATAHLGPAADTPVGDDVAASADATPAGQAAADDATPLAGPVTETPEAPATTSTGPTTGTAQATAATPAPTTPAAMTSTAGTPTAPAGAMPPQVPVSGQLASAVAAMQRRGDGEYVASLDLHPAELGRVRVQIEIRAGVVNVQVAAEQAGTRGLLNDQLADLRAALEQGGMDAGQLDVASHGFGDNVDHDDDRTDSSGRTDTTDAASTALSPLPSPTLVDLPSGRIDVRL
ncbi:flagellar hook-length control protein FliK [Euzebya pacifica]|uniref:flagellar hook-length control protein FliK n=1 Tax=Euzebya pacifica TaxID=1608957 RepID=UPI0030F4DD91